MGHVDRREFLHKAGVASAAAGAVWAAPSVIGQTTAFAVGTPQPTTTSGGPVEPKPCGQFLWGGTRTSVPLSAANGNNTRVSDTGVTMTVTSSLVGSPAPTIESNYRNMFVENRPYSGAGSISGYGNTPEAGLILVQDKSTNALASAVTSYQQVTFSFSAPVTNLTFVIYDLSGNGAVGSTSSNSYMDAVGFDSTPSVVSDTASSRTQGASRGGTGTFTDPFHRLATTDYFIGTAPQYAPYNVPLDLKVSFAGPLSSLTMRYSSLGGNSEQFIKLGNMQSGDGCTPFTPGK